MLVKLPQTCSGQEIVAAFKDAATFYESSEIRWEAEELIYEARDRSGKIVGFGGIQVITSPSYYEKRWIVFGEKTWKNRRNPKIILLPVRAQGYYDAVEITVEYFYATSPHATFNMVVVNSEDPVFANCLPQFNKIINTFLASLQTKVA